MTVLDNGQMVGKAGGFYHLDYVLILLRVCARTRKMISQPTLRPVKFWLPQAIHFMARKLVWH
jgi:hypothetical protein